MADPLRSRTATLAAAMLGTLAIGLPTVSPPAPLIVYNASASAPLGFYRLVAGNAIQRGDLVLARLPEEAARLAATRDYLPASVPVVKHVAALAGDLVCADSGVVVINDRVVADALLIDREGRPLPAWHGCRPLSAGEIFLLMESARTSFDSRYFGPVSAAAVIGRLVALWTW